MISILPWQILQESKLACAFTQANRILAMTHIVRSEPWRMVRYFCLARLAVLLLQELATEQLPQLAV